jgi:hypothetical protein
VTGGSKQRSRRRASEPTPRPVQQVTRHEAGSSPARGLYSSVKNRLSVLFQKINVADRTQAAIYAITHGLAPIEVAGAHGSQN